MKVTRRHFLKGSSGATIMALAASAGLLKFETAEAAWNEAAFKTNNMQDTTRALGGQSAKESKEIEITSPDIAENGAVVPVAVKSKLPHTEMIAILVEKNPNVLCANFVIPESTEPWVSTRVKMGQTSNVHALVKAGGQYYYTTKEIKVTLGGCGG